MAKALYPDYETQMEKTNVIVVFLILIALPDYVMRYGEKENEKMGTNFGHDFVICISFDVLFQLF